MEPSSTAKKRKGADHRPRNAVEGTKSEPCPHCGETTVRIRYGNRLRWSTCRCDKNDITKRQKRHIQKQNTGLIETNEYSVIEIKRFYTGAHGKKEYDQFMKELQKEGEHVIQERLDIEQKNRKWEQKNQKIVKPRGDTESVYEYNRRIGKHAMFTRKCKWRMLCVFGHHRHMANMEEKEKRAWITHSTAANKNNVEKLMKRKDLVLMKLDPFRAIKFYSNPPPKRTKANTFTSSVMQFVQKFAKKRFTDIDIDKVVVSVMANRGDAQGMGQVFHWDWDHFKKDAYTKEKENEIHDSVSAIIPLADNATVQVDETATQWMVQKIAHLPQNKQGFVHVQSKDITYRTDHTRKKLKNIQVRKGNIFFFKGVLAHRGMEVSMQPHICPRVHIYMPIKGATVMNNLTLPLPVQDRPRYDSSDYYQYIDTGQE